MGGINWRVIMSERKHTKTALQESENKFRSLVDNAADALIVHDFNGKIIDVNKRACESLGYLREELLQMNHWDIEQDFDLKTAQEELWLKIKPNKPSSFLGHQRRKDGTIFPVEVRFTLVDFQGQKLSLGLVRDITERLEMENSLKESEIKYKTLFESNPDYTVFLDPRGKILDANIATLESLGSNLDDITGLILSESGIFPQEDIKSYKEKIHQLFKGKRVEPFLARLIDKNGKIHWCQTQLIPIRKEGSLIGYQAIAQDITDKRVAENELRESKKRLFDIIDLLPDATLAIDNHGKVITWNRVIENMTGFKAEEMVGKGNYEYSLPFYGTRRPILIDMVTHSDEDIKKAGYDFVKKEGEIIVAETEAPLKGVNRILWGRALPLYDAKGRFDGAIEVIRDITDLKKAEDEIKASLAEKETLLREIHHRVKNNMQIVSSLLSLQIQHVEEEEKEAINVLKESQNRVRSMALIHEKLYKSDDLNHISISDYILSLVTDLFSSYSVPPDQLKQIIDVEDANLNIETAVPCGLI
jgi:PAS domain S-box-containing protein